MSVTTGRVGIVFSLPERYSFQKSWANGILKAMLVTAMPWGCRAEGMCVESVISAEVLLFGPIAL
jgi:hypothetical protein